MSRPNLFRAELIERIDFTTELAVFRFKPETTFRFRPGQCATIAVEDGDKLLQRPYSLTSTPYDPILEFLIELVPAGKLTPRLWQLAIGTQVWIRNRAVGLFTLAEKSGFSRHLLVCSAAGIAPYLSYIRTLAADKEQGKERSEQFALIHQAAETPELGTYPDEMKTLVDKGLISYQSLVTGKTDNPDANCGAAQVVNALPLSLQNLQWDATNSLAYACGHPLLVKDVGEYFVSAGFPKDNIFEENYFVLR